MRLVPLLMQNRSRHNCYLLSMPVSVDTLSDVSVFVVDALAVVRNSSIFTHRELIFE